MKLIVVAGSGELPQEIVKGAKNKSYEVEVINFSERKIEADETLNLSIEEAQKALNKIEKSEADEAVLAGKIEHSLAFSSLIKHPSFLKIAKRIKNKSPMGILKSIGEMIEERGVKLVSPLKFVSHLTVKEGILVGNLKKEEQEEIKIAFGIAKRIASMDIGLSIAWMDGAVISVEAVEGTDEMVRRAGRFSRGFYVFKVSRPDQDLKFDLPVIGLKTIKNIYNNGGKGLIFEAENTIFLQREEAVKFAKEKGIKVISWKN